MERHKLDGRRNSTGVLLILVGMAVLLGKSWNGLARPNPRVRRNNPGQFLAPEPLKRKPNQPADAVKAAR